MCSRMLDERVCESLYSTNEKLATDVENLTFESSFLPSSFSMANPFASENSSASAPERSSSSSSSPHHQP